MIQPEKKDKIKKKKMSKKETVKYEIEEADAEESIKTSKEEVENGKKESEPEADDNIVKGKETTSKSIVFFQENKNFQQDFYVAHSRTSKTVTDYFQDIHNRKMAELLEAFHLFDFDRDGIINRDDLKKTFQSLNRNDVEDEDIDQMLSEALTPLNFDAFVILLGYKTLDLDPEEVFLDALSNWDNGHHGLISYEELLHDIMAWGDKFTEGEAKAALADAPTLVTKNKEKMIDYIQFSEDLCGLRKMIQRKPTN